MANLPNTTQTPNLLFNGLMKEMSDTELRIVLVVTRATLGWIADLKTGMRKEQDWLSLSQLKKKTGRESGAISKAIDSCIQKRWIEARDRDGNLLDTKNKRRGKNIFYRLGPAILLKTSSESEDVYVTSSKSEVQKPKFVNRKLQKQPGTKETHDKNNSMGSWTKELLKKLEETYGGTLTRSQIGRQAKALGELKEAGYSPSDIWQGIERMRQDSWWKTKNPDFRNLADNTLKFLTNKQKVVDKYANLVIKD